jgi:hypothetical protein
MGRIAYGPSLALRGTKPCGLRGLSRPILEVVEGSSSRLTEAKRGASRLGLRTDDVRGLAGGTCWRGLRPVECFGRGRRAKGGVFAFTPTFALQGASSTKLAGAEDCR